MKEKIKNLLVPHHGNAHTPYLLSHKGTLATLAVVATIQLSLLAAIFILPRLDIEYAAVLPSVVTSLTNNVRAGSNIPDLKVNDLLTQAAQAKAEDMALKGYFAHQSPDGSQPWDWIRKKGYQYEVAGENLAVNFNDSEEVVKAWRSSPTHNLNLMGAFYKETGVGVAKGTYKGREAIFVVQMFGTPKPVVQTVAPRPANRVQTVSTPVRVSSGETSVLGAFATNIEEPAVEVASRVVSSPRTYTTYAYLILAGLFVFVLLLSIIPLTNKSHQPRAILNGALVLGVIIGIMFLNNHLLFSTLELPEDNQNAASVAGSL